MALKGYRKVHSDRADLYVDEVATRGGVLVYSTAGSGAALDQASNLATYAANSSGKAPVGILMEDVVNVDLTKYKLNQHKGEIQKGGKPWVMDKGEVLTNFYVGSPAGGNTAYLSSSGYVTPTMGLTTNVTPVVGRFESSPDEDGYVKLSVNLP